MAVNPVTNRVYVANWGSDTVTVIDGATNAAIATVGAGTNPYAVIVNPVTNKVYVANWGSDTVTVIDGTTNATTAVSVGTEPIAVAVNPVTNKVYVANYRSDTVTVIDGATNATATVSTGPGPSAVAVDPVTDKVYVANYDSNTVTVIDGATNLTTTVNVGTYPRALTVDPATNKAYVANSDSNTVTVIDGATNVATTVPAGSHPSAVAVDPVTNRAYLANRDSNDVTVIDEQLEQPVPLTVAITPLTDDRTASATPSLSFHAATTFAPTAPPVLNVYYQVDTVQGPWLKAAPDGADASGATPPLGSGIHILYAFASNGMTADSVQTGPQSAPLVGSIQAYVFLVDHPSSTWDGGGGDDKWSSAANWADDTVPANGDDLVFSGAVRPANVNDLLTSVGSVSFTQAGFSLSGNALTVMDGISAAGSASWGIDATLGAAQSFTVSSGHLTFTGALANGSHLLTVDGAGSTTISGAISGAGGLTKAGAGTLALSGACAYSGATTVTGGKLLVSGSTAAGSAVSVAAGATLGGSGTVAGSVTLAGILAPGASIGTLASGAQTWNGGARYAFEIGQASGTPGTSWDLLESTGGLTVAATSADPFTIAPISVGALADFDPAQRYAWQIASFPGGLAGFAAEKFVVDASQFAPGLAGGTFGVELGGPGDFALTLVFTPGTPAPAPMISGFTPACGWVGSAVTITGSGFTGATAVRFEGTAATSFTVLSDTRIRALVPRGAGSGRLSVTTPAGTALSAARFTVLGSAPPVVPGPQITSFAPALGPVGTSVTLTGTGFSGATAVAFNGTLATFVVDSAAQITATVPTGATTGRIAVAAPGGTGTSALEFTVTAPSPAPTITSFTPPSGAAGSSVVISGTGFSGATALTFNGSAAAFTVDSDARITAIVPAGATTGPIAVSAPGGSGVSATDFTVIPRPSSPRSGPPRPTAARRSRSPAPASARRAPGPPSSSAARPAAGTSPGVTRRSSARCRERRSSAASRSR